MDASSDPDLVLKVPDVSPEVTECNLEDCSARTLDWGIGSDS